MEPFLTYVTAYPELICSIVLSTSTAQGLPMLVVIFFIHYLSHPYLPFLSFFLFFFLFFPLNQASVGLIFGGAHGLMWQVGMVPWWWIRVVPCLPWIGGAVLDVTKPPWVSCIGGAHGFDVVADVADQGGAEVVYRWVVDSFGFAGFAVKICWWIDLAFPYTVKILLGLLGLLGILMGLLGMFNGFAGYVCWVSLMDLLGMFYWVDMKMEDGRRRRRR